MNEIIGSINEHIRSTLPSSPRIEVKEKVTNFKKLPNDANRSKEIVQNAAVLLSALGPFWIDSPSNSAPRRVSLTS